MVVSPTAAAQVENTAPITEVVVGTATYKVDGDGAVLASTENAAGKFKVQASVTFGDKTLPVTKIAAGAFKKSNVKEVTIPDSVKEIGSNAFAECKKLTKVTFGKGVTKIGSKAFFKCSKLSKITFKGSSLKSVGSKAFKKIKKNATFKVPKKKLDAYKKALKGKTESNAKVKK